MSNFKLCAARAVFLLVLIALFILWLGFGYNWAENLVLFWAWFISLINLMVFGMGCLSYIFNEPVEYKAPIKSPLMLWLVFTGLAIGGHIFLPLLLFCSIALMVAGEGMMIKKDQHE